jgi:hypothetical protein
MQWRLIALSAALVVVVAAIDSEGWEDEDGDGVGRRVSAPYDVDGEVRHDWSQGNLRTWDGAVGKRAEERRALCARVRVDALMRRALWARGRLDAWTGASAHPRAPGGPACPALTPSSSGHSALAVPPCCCCAVYRCPGSQLCLVLGAERQVTWDDDVMVLNGRNFDKMTQKIPHILVEIYAPWCGHCQKFEPVYR